MKSIIQAIKEGSAVGKVNGKQFKIVPANMPLLMELFVLCRRIGITPVQLAPLLSHKDLNNGKPLSKQSMHQYFYRGHDPREFVTRELIQKASNILMRLQRKGVFGNKQQAKEPIFKGEYVFNGEYPKRGNDLLEFLKSAILDNQSK